MTGAPEASVAVGFLGACAAAGADAVPGAAVVGADAVLGAFTGAVGESAMPASAGLISIDLTSRLHRPGFVEYTKTRMKFAPSGTVATSGSCLAAENEPLAVFNAIWLIMAALPGIFGTKIRLRLIVPSPSTVSLAEYFCPGVTATHWARPNPLTLS